MSTINKILNSDRGYNIKKINLNEEHYDELIDKSRNKTDKIIKNPKKPKNKYNLDVIENDDFNSLYTGFLDTPKNKRKSYIKKNKKNFKNLLPEEQRKLFQLFYDYL